MKKIIIFILGVLVLAGCTGSSSGKIGYESISMEQGMKLCKSSPDCILVDVRTLEEYEQGHIPGAVNLPLESIGTQDPEALKNKDQLILVYCRSGNRSKQAAGKLAALGYSNVKEIGGISSWTGSLKEGSQPGSKL
ncbi:MAG: lipoprotein [Erysipelotrichaceae bacterium]|nr:lipoprotein [Erysipelotrichaceae bacterium]